MVSGNAQTDPLATTTTNESRKCPFCAEMVKREAVVCRFCQHELPRYTSEPISVKTQDSSACAAAIVENISTEQQQLMDKLGITHDGEKFQFKEYKYEKLEDVVNYAKKNQQNQI